MDYGLTAVAVEKANRIHQLVMSCRVLGLDVEMAVFRYLQAVIEGGSNDLAIRFIETSANSLVRDALYKAGFDLDDEWWIAAKGNSFVGLAELESTV